MVDERKGDLDAKKCVCMEKESIYRQRMRIMKREEKVTARGALNAWRPDVTELSCTRPTKSRGQSNKNTCRDENLRWNPNDNDIRVV
jgi:hypothetical protein